jgi:NAD+ diphosphatase
MRVITPSRPNAYTGGTLDRAGHRREDTAWVDAALNDAASRFVLFWQGRPLIAGLAEAAPRAVFTKKPLVEAPWVFLGLQNGVAIFAVNLSQFEAPHEALDIPDGDFTDFRAFAGAITADDATILATGRAMLHWREQTKFCSLCGNPHTAMRGGYVMQCTSCGTEHFPRTDPAVIMLVTRGNRLLLGQSHRFPVDSNFYSTLAGFVEPGESLEDAVRREVFEEVGVRVGAVHYHSSQPWPFPASLMLGFYGEGLNEDIVLQADEMRDAKWFSLDDIANRQTLGFNLPPHDSIARRLIEDWLETHR